MKALITGANSLVNGELLGRLDQMGCDITAHYHSDNHITKQLKKTYPKARFIQADFSDETSFRAFYQQILADGKYDIIVNGAVYYAEADDWQVQFDWQAWQNNFAVNTTTAGILMARAEHLVKDGGVIVNISSVFGRNHMGSTQFAMYGASKSAMDLLTKTYAKKWHQKNIRVVGIAPGWVRSAWNKDMKAEEIDAMLGADHLVARLIEPSEIADTMVLLIQNKGLNATTITIDGGLSSPIIG